jgi:light-regulated signal transduction histidine kinase (bacteriophytochrome)
LTLARITPEYPFTPEQIHTIEFLARLTALVIDNNQLLEAAERELRERQQAEEALQRVNTELARSNADLEQFAYAASHDLQEPLRMVTSFTQLLAKRYQGKLDQDADEFIHFAVDGATRMNAMIKGLLEYSRVSRARDDFARTDMNAALAAALRNLKLLVEETNARITFSPLPTVTGSMSLLVQVFQNLLSNALKFRGPPSPAVHIQAVRQDAHWHFTVQDNGIGIAPEYFQRIFVVFQRLHTKDEYPGTGIGLALCKKIIERHDGQIWVESVPGTGTIFHFTLPVSD